MDSDQIYIEQFFVIIDHFLSRKCPLYHGSWQMGANFSC